MGESPNPDPTSDLNVWLERYKKAWEERDPEAAASLFNDDVNYYETPFGPPARGKDGIRTYWSAATQHQKDIHFTYEIVSAGVNIGVARWSAEYTRVPSEVRARLDGVFVLEFDDIGRCESLREWWHRTEIGTLS